MAGPLTDVLPAACAIARQRGRAQHPFVGAGAHSAGDSAAWLVPFLVFKEVDCSKNRCRLVDPCVLHGWAGWFLVGLGVSRVGCAEGGYDIPLSLLY
jgi:hypothetical protein